MRDGHASLSKAVIASSHRVSPCLQCYINLGGGNQNSPSSQVWPRLIKLSQEGDTESKCLVSLDLCSQWPKKLQDAVEKTSTADMCDAARVVIDPCTLQMIGLAE